MLRLDVTFSVDWNSRVDPLKIATMDELDLRYSAVFGDLILIANGVDFSARWGWIPLIDLAVALHDIRTSLLADTTGQEVFDFTESEAEICFARAFDVINIKTNYEAGAADVPFLEFDARVTELRNKVFCHSIKHFPTLEENASFRLLERRTALT